MHHVVLLGLLLATPLPHMSIQQIASSVEKFAPRELAESWDNTGILVDSNTPDTSEKKILLTIDFTLAVLDECIKSGIKYVVSYHPVIFQGLKRLNSQLLTLCIQNQISVYSPHTQLDPLMNSYILKMIGPDPGSFDDIASKIKKLSGLSHFRIIRGCKDARQYKNDGDIVVGVGAAFRNVGMSNCMLITGEMSHHDSLKCKFSGVDVIMMEHSNSERVFMSELKRLIEADEDMSGFSVFISETDCDPVEYY